jgi:hypothetical protein
MIMWRSLASTCTKAIVVFFSVLRKKGAACCVLERVRSLLLSAAPQACFFLYTHCVVSYFTDTHSHTHYFQQEQHLSVRRCSCVALSGDHLICLKF